jgi:hypothetical protein
MPVPEPPEKAGRRRQKSAGASFVDFRSCPHCIQFQGHC